MISFMLYEKQKKNVNNDKTYKRILNDSLTERKSEMTFIELYLVFQYTEI